ncbi:hypothetical protein [Zoogloea sp.]|uniref:hypothetical protein n=1 Tax=Zoogloea sp. TaxID=49181 RepID=UPI0025D458DB|nr:hypothetical protein [Zoogloea sp.]MCK6393511.1 hypothetical protein [Zoogloea sp.]
MKEGSALLVALLLAVAIAYWSDHYRLADQAVVAREAEDLSSRPPPPPALPQAEPVPERLDVVGPRDPVARAALCEELLEVIRGVDAALQLPQSSATIEQLTTRRRVYQEKRATLDC